MQSATTLWKIVGYEMKKKIHIYCKYISFSSVMAEKKAELAAVPADAENHRDVSFAAVQIC